MGPLSCRVIVLRLKARGVRPLQWSPGSMAPVLLLRLLSPFVIPCY